MTKNERGITLIELLAVITILSIIGSIIWNVFFQGFEFSQKAMSINSLQQEANFIVNILTRIHQTSEEYTIIPPDSAHTHGENCQFKVISSARTETIESSRFCYKLIYQNKELVSELHVNPYDPDNGDVELKIIVADQKDSGRNVDVEVMLFRLKGAM